MPKGAILESTVLYFLLRGSYSMFLMGKRAAS